MMRNILLGTCVFASLSTVTLPTFAGAVDASLNDDTAYLKYIKEIGTFTSSADRYVEKSDLTFGLLFNENDDFMLTGSLMSMGQLNGTEHPVKIGIGGKAYYADADAGFDAGALALGGRLSYAIPANKNISIGGEAFYAPSITSFGDADKFYEFSAKIEMQVLSTASIYLGYRSIEADLDSNIDIEFDEGAHIGGTLQF